MQWYEIYSRVYIRSSPLKNEENIFSFVLQSNSSKVSGEICCRASLGNPEWN